MILPFLAACSLASANSVVNGGFEGSSQFVVPNWTIGNPGSGAGGECNQVDYPARSGSCAAYFSSAVQLDSLFQAVPVSVGQAYKLTFYLWNNMSGTNEFQAFWGGTNVFDQTGVPIQGYTQVVIDLGVATNSSTTLDFRGLNVPGAFLLDDVDISPTAPSGVPEPSSLLMVSPGLMLVAAALRRRRS